jgi:hypothetical protein
MQEIEIDCTVFHACGCCQDWHTFEIMVENPFDMIEVENAIFRNTEYIPRKGELKLNENFGTNEDNSLWLFVQNNVEVENE